MRPVIVRVGGREVWSFRAPLPVDVGDEIEFRASDPETGEERWHVVRVKARRWWHHPVHDQVTLFVDAEEVPQ